MSEILDFLSRTSFCGTAMVLTEISIIVIDLCVGSDCPTDSATKL